MGDFSDDVILLCDSLGVGGAEKQILAISKQLAGQMIRTHIVCLRAIKGGDRRSNQVRLLQQGGVSVLAGDTVRGVFQVSRLLARVMIRRRSRVLWTWGAKADVIGLIIALCNPHIRLVCSLRSASEARFRRLRILYAYLVKRAHLFISNSLLALQQLESLIGNCPRSFLLPNFLAKAELDADSVALPDRIEHLRVGMLGNVKFEIKGYDLVLEAAQMLSRENFPVRIQIAGGGPESNRLLREIEERGLGRIIEYVGEVVDTAGFLRSQHVFLLASRFEGMPNALCEAMSLGLPSISTMVGDVAEMNAKEDIIYLCRIGESSDIRDRIVEVLNNWREAKQRGSKSRQLARARFSAEAHIPALLQQLANLEPFKGS